MASSNRTDWLIPTGLIALAAIPILAGMYRLAQLASDTPITPDNLRFETSPVPVILHIASVTIYCILGAFQFHPGFRRRRPGWHRMSGRILVVSGVVAGLSGIWMALTYSIVPADDALLHLLRLFFGAAMVASIVLAFVAIRQRDIDKHQIWMRRAYAIGQGAGTQALTQIPLVIIFGELSPMGLALAMGAGWGINLAVAEWLIRRRRRPVARAAAPGLVVAVPRKAN